MIDSRWIDEVMKEKGGVFAVFERGDRIIKKAKRKAIVLVGNNGAGISCSFNWINKQTMVGAGNISKTHYKKTTKGHDHNYSQLNNGYTPKTLIPNLVDLDEETSLIDLPGFANTRNYKGIMAVSYFLKAVFEQVDSVKFIVVFPEVYLETSNCNHLLSTLRSYLNMFKEMKPSKKEELFQSTSFLVTRSKQPHLCSQNLQYFLQAVTIEDYKFDMKHQIVELLAYMIDRNRLAQFPNAIIDQSAPQCDIMDFLNGMDWRYFDLRKAEQENQGEIIYIPFLEQYCQLKESDKQLFHEEATQKIQNFAASSTIISIAKNNFKETWQKSLQHAHNQSIFLQSILNFEPFFHQVRHFIQKSDKYNTASMSFDIPEQIPPPKFIKTLKTLVGIFEIMNDFNDYLEGNYSTNFAQIMSIFKENWLKILTSFSVFCRNKQQYFLLQRMKFIFQRCVHEFIQLEQIDEQTFAPAKTQAIDRYINSFEDDNESTYLAFFMKYMNKELMRKLIKEEIDCRDFQSLFLKYQETYQYSMIQEKKYEQKYSIMQQKMEFLAVKGQYYQKQHKLHKATLSYVEILKIILQLNSLSDKLSQNTIEKQTKKKHFYISIQKYANKIINFLKKASMNDIPQARKLALALAYKVHNIAQLCQIYKLLVSQTEQLQDKLLYLDQYTQICIRYGRLQKANAVLQQKLSICHQHPREMEQTRANLIKLAQNEVRYRRQYTDFLKKLHIFNYNDTDFPQILTNIINAIRLSDSRSQSFNQSEMISFGLSFSENIDRNLPTQRVEKPILEFHQLD